MKDQTITTGQALALLDSLAVYGSPRVYRVRVWGQSHESTVVAYSLTDARVRVLEIDPTLRIASIVEGVGS